MGPRGPSASVGFVGRLGLVLVGSLRFHSIESGMSATFRFMGLRQPAIAAVSIVSALALFAALAFAAAGAASAAQQRELLGDVDCSGTVDLNDARSLLDFDVGLRTDTGQCPLPNPGTQIYAGVGDFNRDGRVNPLDALLIAQCVAGSPLDACATVTSSIAALEARWAQQRQVIVDRIVEGGFGRDGDLVTGPGGMQIDLSNCPSGWSDTAGIENGVINLLHTTAQSGPLAAYGNIGFGWRAYVDVVNANGGIGPDGLTIDLRIVDDGYVASRTQEIVADALAENEPFYVTTLGSPNTFSVQQTLNDACVPQLLAVSGHQAWGDPVNHPWTTGQQLSYRTEALLWVDWIERNFDRSVSVAALVMDNDIGLAYEQSFEEFASASNTIDDVLYVRHDPAAATLRNEFATIDAAQPDVYISMTTGNPCLVAMEEARRVGFAQRVEALIQPNVCSDVSAYLAPVGEAADGWISVGSGFIDSTDPAVASEPFVEWMNGELAAARLDPNFWLYGVGFGRNGWVHMQVLQIAAELPGGLTRTNLMLAIRSLSMEHPLLYEGIDLVMNGTTDAFLVEGGEIAVFSFEEQRWIVDYVVDANGQTPLCVWVPGEGCS